MATKQYNRDLKAMEVRRRGVRVLKGGIMQADIARELNGSGLGKASGIRSTGLSATPAGQTRITDRRRHGQAGEAARQGRRGQWLPHRSLDAGAGGQVDRPRVRTVIQQCACDAPAAGTGILLPKAGEACHPAERRSHCRMEVQALACAQEKARREGRTIFFIDESGLSERPTRARTWAPKGQAQVLYSFTWKQLSAIAGVTSWNFYCWFFPGCIKSPQLVEFLTALTRQIKGKLLIIWDGLKAHKSRLVREFVESKGDRRIVLDYLPPYAPELNPVEYIWGYLKNLQIANLCAANLHEVSDFARRRLKSKQHCSKLVAAFWKQAELPLL